MFVFNLLQIIFWIFNPQSHAVEAVVILQKPAHYNMIIHIISFLLTVNPGVNLDGKDSASADTGSSQSDEGGN